LDIQKLPTSDHFERENDDEPSNLGVGGHIKWGYYARTWDIVDPWGLLNGRSNPKKIWI